MSGIYIHVPFCKQACYYCDFHFSTNLSSKQAMVAAICKELVLRKSYLQDKIDTIYFGGGTPSMLSRQEIENILSCIQQNFSLNPSAEITLEANPDDLSSSKLEELHQVGINRLSIGIQSFHQAHLQYLHRAHTSTQAKECIKTAQDIGIENISIDLIYAIPAHNHQIWQNDLNEAISLNVPHISSYSLTIEEKTTFGNWLKKGKIHVADEEFAATQFEMLCQNLTQNGFEHYEISNFAKPSSYSKHNTAYWQQIDYLGVGASAHSFNQYSRQYNIANNSLYIKNIEQNIIPATIEHLSLQDKANEYLLTGLRTMWGCDLEKLKSMGVDLQKTHYQAFEHYLLQEFIYIEANHLKLTQKGKLLADKIVLDFFA